MITLRTLNKINTVRAPSIKYFVLLSPRPASSLNIESHQTLCLQVEIRNGSIGGDIHRTIVTVNCDNNVSTDVSEADHDNETSNTSDNKHEQVDLNNNNENCADASSGGGEDKTYFQLKIPIKNSLLVKYVHINITFVL